MLPFTPLIFMLQPHPNDIIKMYIIDDILKFLKKEGML